jgi:hypothetical protein
MEKPLNIKPLQGLKNEGAGKISYLVWHSLFRVVKGPNPWPSPSLPYRRNLADYCLQCCKQEQFHPLRPHDFTLALFLFRNMIEYLHTHPLL